MRNLNKLLKQALTLVGLVLFIGLLWFHSASAQQFGLPRSDVLTISSERLFSGSDFGQRVAQELEGQSAVLAAENRKIEAELSAEEQELTTRRETMEPAAFRTLAEAFDRKVQDIRRTQDAKARSLGERGEAARIEFVQVAQPVLENLMREAGASVILENNSVFLRAPAIDITDIAIARINQTIGDGQTSDVEEDQ